MIIVKSKGIRKNPYIKALLGDMIYHEYLPFARYYAVWGKGKETNQSAEEEAKTRSMPILRLEDGLIRSFSLEEPSFSLYRSESGIYYDATEPSNIEMLLNSNWRPTNEEVYDYEICLELIKKYKISKYNSAIDCPGDFIPKSNKGKILLVDQTYGDKSIEYGLGDEKSFKEMLHYALSLSNENDIYIKEHPEVSVGKKRGYLRDLYKSLDEAEKVKVKIINDNYNGVSVLEQFDKIFVVTSQLGFDALLRNKEVVCFGVPFYSNWGITTDFKKIERRKETRTIAEIFIAIMFKYTNYVNPFNGEVGRLENVLEYISLQKRNFNNKEVVLYKTKFWKKVSLSRFLNFKKTKFVFCANKVKEYKNELVATWGVENYQDIKDLNHKCCVEDGFVRSVGLGSDIQEPISLVVDKGGIYFNPSNLSDLENILNNERFTQYEVRKGKETIDLLLNKRITKYNIGIDGNHLAQLKANNSGKKIILVPGQVESDASIKYGARSIKTNLQLLKEVSKNNSDSLIIYKPHPDVLSGNRKGENPEQEIESLKKLYPGINYHIEKTANILDCFDISDEVHVITSTSGLEAILRGKRVFTYGLPFYGGYGLTIDKEEYPRKRKHLSKEELILGCYVLYPRYMLPDSKVFTNVGTAINHISRNKKNEVGFNSGFISQVKRKVKLCIRTIQALS